MRDMNAGDIVCALGSPFKMLVLSREEDPPWSFDDSPKVSCAWEHNRTLHTRVFRVCDLIMVRKERRRAIRAGDLEFPAF